MPSLTCPKCSATMEEGYVVDHTYGGMMPAEWIEGKPIKSFWMGLKIAKDTNHAVKTYRCTDCGFLESYARPE